MSGDYTIGTFAKAGGVHVETVRYYERLGILQQPSRRYGKVRRYQTADLERLRFIQRAKSAGFNLAEIHSLIRFENHRSCRDTRALAAKKLQAVETRMRELRTLRMDLRRWIELCDANSDGEGCPALSALAGKDDEHHKQAIAGVGTAMLEARQGACGSATGSGSVTNGRTA